MNSNNTTILLALALPLALIGGGLFYGNKGKKTTSSSISESKNNYNPEILYRGEKAPSYQEDDYISDDDDKDAIIRGGTKKRRKHKHRKTRKN